jgi:hypothetical protein
VAGGVDNGSWLSMTVAAVGGVVSLWLGVYLNRRRKHWRAMGRPDPRYPFSDSVVDRIGYIFLIVFGAASILTAAAELVARL